MIFLMFCLYILFLGYGYTCFVHLIMTKRHSKNFKCINNASSKMFFKEFDKITWYRKRNFDKGFFIKSNMNYDEFFGNYIHASIFAVNGICYMFHNPIEYYKVISGLNKRRSTFEFQKE